MRSSGYRRLYECCMTAMALALTLTLTHDRHSTMRDRRTDLSEAAVEPSAARGRTADGLRQLASGPPTRESVPSRYAARDARR